MRQEMSVEIAVTQGRYWVKESMLRTAHKVPISTELSDEVLSGLLLGRHSPIRQYRMRVLVKFCSDRAHTHLVRHRGVDPYVASLREDICKALGVDPEDFKDEDGNWVRVMSIFLGADQLIHIGKFRLCTGSVHPETLQVVKRIKSAVALFDPCLAQFMQPHCIWYGMCTEPAKYCGFDITPAGVLARDWFLSLSKRLISKKR